MISFRYQERVLKLNIFLISKTGCFEAGEITEAPAAWEVLHLWNSFIKHLLNNSVFKMLNSEI